jgi:hypothetical protein
LNPVNLVRLTGLELAGDAAILNLRSRGGV